MYYFSLGELWGLEKNKKESYIAAQDTRLCPSIVSLELLIKATPARHEALPVNPIARAAHQGHV